MIKILSLFYGSWGYGAQLQSYALCKILLINSYNSGQVMFSKVNKKPNIYSRAKNISILKIIRKLSSVLVIFFAANLKKRFTYFNDFFNRICHSSTKYDKSNISNYVNNNDIFIVGSDQVWNPAWTEDSYFLNFVPDHNGKIAYAASIGTNSVSQTFLEHVVPLINRFDFISVREESAKEILQPYVDKPIKVVLDPTLLLTRDEWDKIAVQPAVPQPYIFVYLLGEKREHRRLIKKYAKTLGLKIVFLPHVHFRFNPADCFFSDYNLYDVGPREFVGLIKNAEMVITDSFHGCVFSIIYQKKFWALKRHKDSEKENMNSRLYTLFDSLGLQDRLIEDESTEYDAKSLNRQIDYSQVEAKLDALRKDSSDFLLNAIESVRKRMEDDKRTEAKNK